MDEMRTGLTWYRYPARSAYPDYLRAGVGAVLCIIIMAGLPLGSVSFWLLAVILAALGLFAMQARRRQLTGFALDQDNLWRGWLQSDRRAESNSGAGGALEARFAWCDLAAMRLAYFSVRRDGRSGWMELKLSFGGATVRVDSRLDGFSEIVRAGLGAAQANELELDQSTLSNLESMDMGLTVARVDEGLGGSAECERSAGREK